VLAEAIAAFVKDEGWTHALVDGAEFKANDKHRFAAGLIAQVHEHAVSIRLLLELQNPGRRFGSAGALVRPTFEGLVRALWILDCATDEQVAERMENDEDAWNPGLKAMCKAVDKVLGSKGFYEKLWADKYPAMCSYAHGGMRVVGKNVSAEGVEPTSSEEDWSELVSFAHAMDLLGTHAALTFSDRSAEAARCLERAETVLTTATGALA